MAQHGSFSGEFDIKSPAGKFFKFLMGDINKTFGQHVVEWTDEEKRTVTIGLSGSLITDTYKNFKATFTVTSMKNEANGSKVVWTIKFEKIRDDPNGPQWIINILLSQVKEADEKLSTI